MPPDTDGWQFHDGRDPLAATSRQRFLATLDGEPVEAPFLWESGIWEAAVARWRSEGLPQDADPYEVLGLERVASSGVNYLPEPPLAERVIEDNGEAMLIETEAGGRLRRYRNLRIPGNLADPMEEPIVFPVRDRASWAFMKSRLDPSSARRREPFEAFLAGRRRTPTLHSGLSGSFDPDDGCATVFYIMMPVYWLVRHAGFEAAAVMPYDDPALIEEICAFMADFIAVQLEPVLSRRAPDLVVLNEGASASAQGPFMSPDMYRRLAIPGLARVTEICRAAGVPHVFANCGGNLAQLVPAWKDAGLDGVMPLDNATDVDTLCSEHPDLAMIGGIDRRVLEADPDDLQRRVLPRARALYAHGKAIPSGDAHFPISSAVSFDNMRLYMDLRRHAAASYS